MKKRKNAKAATASKKILNPGEELFCRYYTQNDALFCNATLSYAEAFNYGLDELSKNDSVYDTDDRGYKTKIEDSTYEKAYNVCSVMGHKFLRTVKIQDRITELLGELLVDKVVDSHLASTIMQNKDLPSKVAAIREYNKLRSRIIDKHDLTSGGKVIKQVSVASMTEKEIDEYLKNKLIKPASGKKPK